MEYNDKDSKELLNNRRKQIHGYILSGIVGGIISAGIVIVLLMSNIIPMQSINTIETSTPQLNQPVTTAVSTNNEDTSANITDVSSAVVGIVNMQQQDVWTANQEAGSGSGIIYKKKNGKAYVVTNNHVVNGATTLQVVLNTNEQIEAKLLGTDALTDLAILEIDGSKVKTVAKLGASKDLKVGETAIAIGNPLGLDFSGSVTRGIISGLNRAVEVDTNGDQQPDWITEVIQTDAAINPGNSGGALVNSKGEVIGINSMKIAREAVEGIGFAIPIDTALPIMEQLEANGDVKRPFIGVSTAALQEVPPQFQEKIAVPADIDYGIVVADVQQGSPADKAGLQQFDVITKINDKEMHTYLDLRTYMYANTKIGDKVQIEIYRNGKKQIITLQLIEQKR